LFFSQVRIGRNLDFKSLAYLWDLWGKCGLGYIAEVFAKNEPSQAMESLGFGIFAR